MFLSSREIASAVQAGQVSIEPFFPELLKPASYVLRLGGDFLRWTALPGHVDVFSQDAARGRLTEVGATNLLLKPGDLVLGKTLERISIPEGFIGVLSSLSHVSRFGLCVHGESFWISPGFGADSPMSLTLELSSANPNVLRLQSGMPVCHLALARTEILDRKGLPLGRSIYEGQAVPSTPRLFEEFEELLKTIRERA